MFFKLSLANISMIRRRNQRRALKAEEKNSLEQSIKNLRKYGVKVDWSIKYTSMEAKADTILMGVYSTRVSPRKFLKLGKKCAFLKASPEGRKEIVREAKKIIDVLEKSSNVDPSRINYQRKMIEELERHIED